MNTSNMNNVTGQFNGIVDKVLLVILEEAGSNTTHANMNILKNLITEEERIQPKGSQSICGR